MTKIRITPASGVVVGHKILMNGTVWEITGVVPGEFLTIVYAAYGGALLTLRAPNDLTVSVVDEFYTGRPLEFWGLHWRVQRSDESRIWLSSGPNIELAMSMDALREEMS